MRRSQLGHSLRADHVRGVQGNVPFRRWKLDKNNRDSSAARRSTRTTMHVQRVAIVRLTSGVETGVNFVATRNALQLACRVMVSVIIRPTQRSFHESDFLDAEVISLFRYSLCLFETRLRVQGMKSGGSKDSYPIKYWFRKNVLLYNQLWLNQIGAGVDKL